MRLAGKTIVVTGAGRRIGRAVALALAERGAQVVVHYHTSAADAQEVVTAIRQRGGRALAVRADQRRGRQVEAAVERAYRHFGRLDGLVASAAVFRRTPWARVSEADWDEHLDANLKGPFLFARAVGRRMRTGKMIFFADWAAWRPYRDYLPYVVSKAGVVCLTRALARELAPRVQVNAIAPGPVLLPEDFTPAQRRAVIRATLVKRLGSPADIVNSVLFLLEGSDFITGHVLVVDGGRLLGS